jgi:hypothetical protein
VSGQAELACATRSQGGRPRPARCASNARYWAERWKACLPPAPDATRPERLGRSVARWQALRLDIAAIEAKVAVLLASTAGAPASPARRCTSASAAGTCSAAGALIAVRLGLAAF